VNGFWGNSQMIVRKQDNFDLCIPLKNISAGGAARHGGESDEDGGQSMAETEGPRANCPGTIGTLGPITMNEHLFSDRIKLTKDTNNIRD
jgi:hypothetical protein